MAKAYSDYSIGDLKRLNLSFLVKDEDKEKEQRAAFTYLLKVAHSANIRIDDWKLLKVFGDDSEPTMVTDKKEINKRMFEKIQAMPVPTTCFGKDKLVLAKRDIISKTKGDLDDEILRKTRERDSFIEGASERYNAYLRNLRLATDRTTSLKALEILKASGELDDSVYNSIASILNNDFWQYLFMDSSYIYFGTTKEVIQTEKNVAAGVDITVNMGLLVAKLNFDSGSISVQPGLGTLLVQNNYHTHVSSRGEICWGDASDRAADYITSKQYYELFCLLQTLLLTYSSANPYVSLAGMDEYIEGAGWEDQRIDSSHSEISNRSNWTVIPSLPPLNTLTAPFCIEYRPEVGAMCIFKVNGNWSVGMYYRDRGTSARVMVSTTRRSFAQTCANIYLVKDISILSELGNMLESSVLQSDITERINEFKKWGVVAGSHIKEYGGESLFIDNLRNIEEGTVSSTWIANGNIYRRFHPLAQLELVQMPCETDELFTKRCTAFTELKAKVASNTQSRRQAVLAECPECAEEYEYVVGAADSEGDVNCFDCDHVFHVDFPETSEAVSPPPPSPPPAPTSAPTSAPTIMNIITPLGQPLRININEDGYTDTPDPIPRF